MTGSTDLMLRQLASKHDDSTFGVKKNSPSQPLTTHQAPDNTSSSMEDVLTHCLGSTKQKDLTPGS